MTLNRLHPNTAQCAKGLERKWYRLVAEEAWASTEMDFMEYCHPLTNVAAFKYIGRILTATDNGWLAVVVNLRKARKEWA